MNNEPKKTNALCIAGLVCSFLIAPLGLILSIVGVVQVKKNDEEGKALGIAGIIIGALGTLFIIITVTFAFMAFVNVASEMSAIKPDVEDIIKDSTSDISRVKAEGYLKNACSELDADGNFIFSDNDEYTIKCEDFTCTLKNGDKTFTRSCKSER